MIKRFLPLLLALCMLLSMSAFAEDTTMAEVTEAAEAVEAEETAEPVEEPVEPAVELNETDVVCTLNGEAITWGDCLTAYDSLVESYGASYDLTSAQDANLFRAVALDQVIVEKLMETKAVELGLDQFTDEEKAEIIAASEMDWDNAIASYISNFYPELDTADEAAVAAANEEAVAYYGNLGYTKETLGDMYLQYETLNRVQAYMVQDAVVTDEEVQAQYQALVDADRELYENDLAGYCEYNNYVDMMAYYSAYYGGVADMHYAWYKPEGFRAVKHILLPVDEALMTAWTDLTAKLEEQQDEAAQQAEAAEAAETETAAEAEGTAEPETPVTQEMVDAAYADILASKADIIDEINAKIVEGIDFDELIATYGVDADGNASDPGMVNEPTKTTGYEVCDYSSNYVKAFVDAAMSIEAVGEVSAPYVSDYGIHIVKYIADVPAGPVELSEKDRQQLYSSLLNEKQQTLYTTVMEDWHNAAVVAYTGLIPSVDELQ